MEMKVGHGAPIAATGAQGKKGGFPRNFTVESHGWPRRSSLKAAKAPLAQCIFVACAALGSASPAEGQMANGGASPSMKHGGAMWTERFLRFAPDERYRNIYHDRPSLSA
jgi:hypothetical protein